ncbi:MAG: polymorphic toxin type 15 domain-containing protein [Lachnospiraceae bacterium]|nr:polymorphic toxin type 15 domain-containing protein [Lachnospiraceae bacterium]
MMGFERNMEIPSLNEVGGHREISEASRLPEQLGSLSEANRLPDEIGSKTGLTESGSRANMKEAKPSVERMEVPINIRFKCPENLDAREFSRQLKGQERGLNGMTMDRWLENRNRYLENGRALESVEAQKIARQKALTSRIETNQKNGMSYSEAKAEASNWIKTQAALHNPDQIAGGDPEKVSRMGDAGVNSSIGSQWKSAERIGKLDTVIREYADGKTPEELSRIKLNVKLEMEA